MLFAAVRRSLLAQSGHSLCRNNLVAIAQERTKVGLRPAAVCRLFAVIALAVVAAVVLWLSLS